MDGVGNLTVSSSSSNACNDTIDDFRNQVYSTLYSMISVVGFFGNGFVLYILIKTYHEKSAYQVYMINLAVADLLCVCTLPLRVVYYVHKGIWLFGDFLHKGFYGGSDGEDSTYNAGGLASISGLGRSPGEGNSYPLQYSCLENSMDRGAKCSTVHGVTKRLT